MESLLADALWYRYLGFFLISIWLLGYLECLSLFIVAFPLCL